MAKRSFFSFTLADLREYLVANGCARFAADQVYHWVYRQFAVDPELWTNISKKIRALCADQLDFSLPKVVFDVCSVDGTRKFLLQLSDGHTVETVIIPAEGRLTQCLSSQVGCAMGCLFCNTGTMGFIRHLDAGEVVGQYLAIALWMKKAGLGEERISNLVYMGQGEPLHNFDQMLQATKIFMEDKGLGIGGRKITLSTSGLAPQIEKLDLFPAVNLAISLHSPNDAVRNQLMPINKKYDLGRLFEALAKVPLREHRSITYEYLLIAGLTDRLEDVEGLMSLLDRQKSKINLIPFNEFPGSEYKRPSDQQVQWFKKKLLDAGYVCTTRVSKGADIMAACGQLKSAKEKKEN